MKFFRIYIYLPIKYFFFSFLKNSKNSKNKIKKILNRYTQKKFTILTGQLRVGFYLVLSFLKKKYPKKKEIIINSYNLAEMINVCKNLNLKPIFPKLNKNIFISENDLKKRLNKQTIAVVVTNIFNSSEEIIKIRKICKQKKICLIEDNAIYFGNYRKRGNKKFFSGSFGDFSLHSFNIMKNISGMYGGSVSTNDKLFYEYSNHQMKRFIKFPKIKYIKQCMTYIILKILSLDFLYKYIFINIISWSHKTKNKFLFSMMYPTIKFKKGRHNKNFYTKMSQFSEKIILQQLIDLKKFKQEYHARKKNNLYYEKLFGKIKNKNFDIIKIKEKNFQNFNEYPIIVKNKYLKLKLINYLLDRGIETKIIQYADCDKIFGNKIKISSNNYQDRIICFPNHPKINQNYIAFISYNMNNFFKRLNEQRSL